MNFQYESNRIFAKDEKGQLIAEVTFPDAGDEVVNINHTFVDPSLRGQGVASILLDKAYEVIKRQNKKAVLSCSYAAVWFDRHPECKDIVF